MFKNPFNDPGDKFDPIKWNFPENNSNTSYNNNYLYKYYNQNNLNTLIYIRAEISKLTNFIFNLPNSSLYTYYLNNINQSIITYPDFKNHVILFLQIHHELPNNTKHIPNFKKNHTVNSSLYLLSEMPPNNKTFSGLNKPKYRYISNSIPIGTDKSLRPTYRDIFLVLGDKKSLKDLVLHELAHSMANHVLFRTDDHKYDFILCEKFLIYIANQTNFMSDILDI